MDLLLVVLIFSFIQSVFGVGLLLFGTPTLLLLGYPYDVVLWSILPSSIAISFIQVVGNYKLVSYKRDVVFYTLPFLILCLIFIIFYNNSLDIKKIVGFMLITIGITKSSNYFSKLINTLIKKNIKFYYITMGIVHGVSNMGGGMLSVLMLAMHKDKHTIRTNIAFVYLLFGLVQLFVLFIVTPGTFQLNGVLLIFISIISYLFVNKIFALDVNEEAYQNIFTILIFSYGVLSFY
jgi:uncharacterized protein